MDNNSYDREGSHKRRRVEPDSCALTSSGSRSNTSRPGGLGPSLLQVQEPLAVSSWDSRDHDWQWREPPLALEACTGVHSPDAPPFQAHPSVSESPPRYTHRRSVTPIEAARAPSSQLALKYCTKTAFSTPLQHVGDTVPRYVQREQNVETRSSSSGALIKSDVSSRLNTKASHVLSCNFV